MWRLSILPSAESGLEPCDFVVHGAANATAADLARALGRHLAPEATIPPLLAPVTDGRPWTASRQLTACGLRHGDVVEVRAVGHDWLDRPGGHRAPLATVHVLTGPNAGTQVPVHDPAITIGRSRHADVRLTDPLVSREHARVLLSPTPVVTDQGSAHGTRVGDRTVRRAESLAWDEPVTVGGTTLVLREGVGSPAAELSVSRPPRLGHAVVVEELDAPTPPSAPRARPFPWAMLMMPVVLGAGMLAMTRRPAMLVYVVAWPVMMLATHVMQGRSERKEQERLVAAWRAEADELLASLDESAAVQRAHLDADEPRPPLLRGLVASGDPRVWQRQVRHDDFLSVSAGRGPVAAARTAKAVTGGDPALREVLRGEVAERAVLTDLPVALGLGSLGCLALVAEDERTRHDALRAFVTRLAVTHSPADLALAAVLGPESRHVETWLRWLPHAGRRIDGLAPVAVGSGEGVTLLQQCVVDTSFAGDLVVVVDEAAGVPVRVVEGLVAATAAPVSNALSGQSARPRVHVVWLGRSAATVPPSAGAVVTLDGDAPSVALGDRGGITPLTEVDGLDLATTWHIARTLNSFRDDAALVPPESAMPDVVRLTDLGGDLRDPSDVEGILSRWAAASGLRAQIGAGADGIVTLDLREDGPHGLVAGTTGSGKSELLQTLICSLAVNNPPSRITFLLVDYKGGAAFRECADLPHSVGYITDLTPALVQRALVSLHAELATREHLLEEYGAKDLVALERSHPEVAPPSLLICVDEFAALTAEVPEFVDGMVSIAQRGRSLGMHMILATQRPAGVVTPQIKANTDLRIALRIASEDDSTDVIDLPDAARLSRRTPGRAWVKRTGHGTTELVQVAYAGARERLAAAQEAVRLEPFTAAANAANAANAAAPGGAAGAGGEETAFHPRSDLDRLVAATNDAFVRSGRPAPRRPWLPALPAEVRLDVSGGVRLATPDGVTDPGATGDGRVVIGMVDRPGEQVQEPLVVDYAKDGHLLTFGSSGSGKTELLRTVAISASVGSGDTRPYVYGLDFGGGGLSTIAGLPSVGAIVPEHTLDRCLRLIRMVHRTVTDRNATLAAHAASDVNVLAAKGISLPRIHLLIDNLTSLVDTIDGAGPARRGHVDLLVQVLQEGRRCGVHVSATTPQRVGLPAAMLACFAQRLVLRMTVDDDYAMLGCPTGVVDRDSAPGRGLQGRHEVQLASIGPAEDADAAVRRGELDALLANAYADRPAVDVAVMPGRLPAEVLPDPDVANVCLGVEADFVVGVWLDLAAGPLAVFGRARTGRTSLLRAIAQVARRSSRPPSRIVLVGPHADRVAGDPAFDVVAHEPDDVLAAVDDLAGSRADAAEGDWALLLVDDAHAWERGGDPGGSFRELCLDLAGSLGDAQGQGIAVVLTGDPEEARQRQHFAGPVRAARQGRRTVLLSPEIADGPLAGAMVPATSLEPTSGTGRGVLSAGGVVQVVQFAAGSDLARLGTGT